MKTMRFFILLASLLFQILIFLVSLGVARTSETISPTQKAYGLGDLPVPAQASVSSALGEDNRAYHFQSVPDGWRVQSPKQGLKADLTSQGLEVRAGDAHLALGLVAYGRGNAVNDPGQRLRFRALPQIKANRIEFDLGPVTEWYINGPIGLEQGFTVQAPPTPNSFLRGNNNQGITLALTLYTNLKIRVDSGDKGITLHHPDGQAVLTYHGLTAFDATGRELRASLEFKEQKNQLLLQVDDTDASYPLTIDPWIQSAKLTASDGRDNDLFGYSVAISGDTIVVGAYNAYLGGTPGSGKAYVFVKPPGGWITMTQTAKLASSGESWEFGNAVAISGDTIVVGAYKTTVNMGPGRGAAYVFVKPGSAWTDMTQSARLTASDGANDDHFGNSVDISGDTIVVGAYEDDFGTQTLQGSAYVFVKPVGGWSGELNQVAKLSASDGAGYNFFGSSVGISGDTIVVGAANAAVGGNTSQGSAYVFVKPGSAWTNMTQTAKLTSSDGRTADRFGTSVAIDSNTIVVGAPFHSVGSNGSQGTVYVFVKPGSAWTNMTQSAKLTASDGATSDDLGCSVAISGDNIVAGAYNAHINNTFPGSAYVFHKPVGGWTGDQTQSAKLIALEATSAFGWAMGISGGTIVVGTNFFKESAYVFSGFSGSRFLYLPLILK